MAEDAHATAEGASETDTDAPAKAEDTRATVGGAKTPRVVIVGGGAAGASAAITLAERGLPSVVLESRREPEFKVGESLPPEANPILERLGLHARLEQDGHFPSYGNRSVWGSPKPLERDFIYGTQGHGWHLDRRKFEAALADRARATGADWRCGWRLLKCAARPAGGWLLDARTPSGAESLEADFVVDATGRASRVARQLGARQIRYDRLVGVSLLMEAQAGRGIRESQTLVEAVATGWWYSARLPGDKLMVVYMTDSDLLSREARGTSGWLALLEETEHIARRVREGGYRPSPTATPRLLPAGGTRLEELAGERWLAVGDAAAAYDPLSSYGISAALGTGFYAANAIADLFDGNARALTAYARLVNDAYERYLLMQRELYAAERRWPDEPFWRRRHNSSTP